MTPLAAGGSLRAKDPVTILTTNFPASTVLSTSVSHIKKISFLNISIVGLEFHYTQFSDSVWKTRIPCCPFILFKVVSSYMGCLISQHATLVLWLSKGFYCSASCTSYEVKIWSILITQTVFSLFATIRMSKNNRN